MDKLKSLKNVWNKNRKLAYIVTIPLLAAILPIVANNKVYLSLKDINDFLESLKSFYIYVIKKSKLTAHLYLL